MITAFDIFAKPGLRGTNLSISQTALQLGVSTKALTELLKSRGVISYEDVNAKNKASRICVCDFFRNNGFAEMFISSGKGSRTGAAKRFSQSTITQKGVSFIRKEYSSEIARLRSMSKTGETIEQIVAL